MILLSVFIPYIIGIVLIQLYNEPNNDIKGITAYVKASRVCLYSSNISLLFSLILYYSYDLNGPLFQYKVLGPSGLAILGVDGISLILIILVNIINSVVILTSVSNEKKSLTLLNCVMSISLISNIIFSSLNILIFYISFESSLLPMYLLILYYGSRNRKIEASYLLMLYTIFGSLLLLITFLIIIMNSGTMSYEVLINNYLIQKDLQMLLFPFILIAFLIKIPSFPFHIWLPQVHSEAPTEGSIILAAILLKLGTYGLIRYNLILLKDVCGYYKPLIITISIIGLIYSSVCALSLVDIKQVIAYSSIAHMNLSLIGLFSNDLNGLTGAIAYAISHGFISTALFLLIGLLYERYHTRTIKYYRGITLFMPLYITILLFFTLSNISLPTTAGFVPELLIYLSTSTISLLLSIFTCLAAVLLPIYLLWNYQKISYGRLSPYIGVTIADLNYKELHLLLFLAFSVLFLGLYPSILDPILYSVYSLLY